MKTTPDTTGIEENEVINTAILNLIFSGISIEQMGKIPDWLLENIEKNKTEFLNTLHQQLQKARHDWLREEIVRLEGMKKPEPDEPHEMASQRKWDIWEKLTDDIALYNEALQTIIDRYQSELNQGE